MINNEIVFWISQKQTTVAASIMKIKYMTLSDAFHEAIAWQQLFTDIDIFTIPLVLYSDNQAALAIVRYHFIRDTVQNDKNTIDYVLTG